MSEETTSAMRDRSIKPMDGKSESYTAGGVVIGAVLLLVAIRLAFRGRAF